MRYARHLATVIGTKRRGFDSRHARFLNACMVSEKFKRDPMVSNVDQTVSKEIKRFRKKSKRFRKQESGHRRAWRHLDRDQSGKVLKTGFECAVIGSADHHKLGDRSAFSMTSRDRLVVSMVSETIENADRSPNLWLSAEHG